MSLVDFLKNLFRQRTLRKNELEYNLKYFIDNPHTQCFIYESPSSTPKNYTEYSSRRCLHKASFVFGYDALKGKYKVLKNKYNGEHPEFESYNSILEYLDFMFILSHSHGNLEYGIE